MTSKPARIHKASKLKKNSDEVFDNSFIAAAKLMSMLVSELTPQKYNLSNNILSTRTRNQSDISIP